MGLINDQLVAYVVLRISLIACFDKITEFFIVNCIDFCVLDHSSNLFFGKARGCFYYHGLGFTTCLVFCRYVENAVSIDIKCDLNLRSSSGRWGNIFKIKLTKRLVVYSALALSL